MKLPHLAKLRPKPKPLDYTPTPPLHEDLGGMTETQIELEIGVVTARIEKGITQPEGIDGLQYRLRRLEAQAKVVKRRK